MVARLISLTRAGSTSLSGGRLEVRSGNDERKRRKSSMSARRDNLGKPAPYRAANPGARHRTRAKLGEAEKLGQKGSTKEGGGRDDIPSVDRYGSPPRDPGTQTARWASVLVGAARVGATRAARPGLRSKWAGRDGKPGNGEKKKGPRKLVQKEKRKKKFNFTREKKKKKKKAPSFYMLPESSQQGCESYSRNTRYGQLLVLNVSDV